MKYVSREEQLQLSEKNSYKSFSLKNTKQSDDLLDGVPIQNKPTVQNWIEENNVHKAKFLSNSIESTRMFVGKQNIATRDEQRQITHLCLIEKKGLLLCSLQNDEVIQRIALHKGFTQRATLCLNKFTGDVYTLHCSDTEGGRKLMLNNTVVETKALSPDFPCIELSQPSIGHIAKTNPEYGLATYKCRQSGKIYIRTLDVVKGFGTEQELKCAEVLGGADIAISGEKVLIRIEAIIDGALVPMLATSNDRGKTITNFKAIDLPLTSIGKILPTNAPLVTDHLGNFQVPLVATKDGHTALFNITPNGEIVEAIRIPGEVSYVALEKFPRTTPNAVDGLGRGNGVTDGLGLIATIQSSSGELLSSNSQAGGHHFPKETLLNFEMPKTFCFKVSECYTKGNKPNTVSMDYIFIEADEIGDPVSQKLILETWHMPLPLPVVEAVSKEKTLIVKILSDGWFEQGKTTFTFSDPSINIVSLKIINRRHAELELDTANLKGVRIAFEMKNIFYHHRGEATIR